MKRSCDTCDWATRLDHEGNAIYAKEDKITLGYYCAVVRMKYLFDVAPEDCPEWDEASEDRYPKK